MKKKVGVSLFREPIRMYLVQNITTPEDSAIEIAMRVGEELNMIGFLNIDNVNFGCFKMEDSNRIMPMDLVFPAEDVDRSVLDLLKGTGVTLNM